MSFENSEEPQQEKSAERYEETFAWNSEPIAAESAGQTAREKLIELGWPEDQAESFSRAVEGAVDQGILHGNGVAEEKTHGSEKRKVRVAFKFDADEASAVIEDEGDFVPYKVEGNEELSRIILNSDKFGFSPGKTTLYKERKDNQDVLE